MIYQVKQREAELRGETKGRQEGIVEGKEQQAKEMAISLHSLEISSDKIAMAAKVSVETVQKWLSEPHMTPAK